MLSADDKTLYEKYDIAAPRYTSYPTVPYWEGAIDLDAYLKSVNESIDAESTEWSLYLHIPFCETLCSFCGCNTIITKDHSREHSYVQLLIDELDMYLERVPALAKRPLRELHLGGGTPSFLSVENLSRLLDAFYQRLSLAQNFQASIEADPRHTHIEQLEALAEYRFRRISIGVQDFNHSVQKLVNRLQPYACVKQVVEQSRALGFESVNLDLIYGLPRQTLACMQETIAKTLELRPDRIALYSLAWVPWIKPSQRLFRKSDLPMAMDKWRLYAYAKEQLLSAAYLEIAMDHFALPADSLAIAQRQRTLHRNFMGYTAHRTDLLLGLGVSAISQTKDFFYQNQKMLDQYKTNLGDRNLAFLRGHALSKEDQFYASIILELMTRGELVFPEIPELRTQSEAFLAEMQTDGLIEFIDSSDTSILRLTPKGRPFLRNVCLAFDQRLRRAKPDASCSLSDADRNLRRMAALHSKQSKGPLEPKAEPETFSRTL